MSQALLETDYLSLRKEFCSKDLVPLIQSRKDFINEWIIYSEDKRTSGGYYIMEDGVIGQVDEPETMRFGSIEEAVAEYIVKELDFWAAVGKSKA